MRTKENSLSSPEGRRGDFKYTRKGARRIGEKHEGDSGSDRQRRGLQDRTQNLNKQARQTDANITWAIHLNSGICRILQWNANNHKFNIQSLYNMHKIVLRCSTSQASLGHAESVMEHSIPYTQSWKCVRQYAAASQSWPENLWRSYGIILNILIWAISSRRLKDPLKNLLLWNFNQLFHNTVSWSPSWGRPAVLIRMLFCSVVWYL